MAADKDLEFPRVVYKGEPDTLGTGNDKDGNQLESQTMRCESADQWAELQKQGWRLTREKDGKADEKGKK